VLKACKVADSVARYSTRKTRAATTSTSSAVRTGARRNWMTERSTSSEAVPESISKAGILLLSEAGDGRYLIELTGVARFRVEEEISTTTAYRQCRVNYDPFIDDFTARKGEDAVDRDRVLRALSDFLKANDLKADWDGIKSAPNEALVNALAMMCPYSSAEKQALLEAPDLKTRAEILVAVTEIELAKKTTGGETPLQ